jgi:hypothetical protein
VQAKVAHRARKASEGGLLMLGPELRLASQPFFHRKAECEHECEDGGRRGFEAANSREVLGRRGAEAHQWCHIAIFPPLENEGDGNWLSFRAIHTTLGTTDMLRERIAEKEARVGDYRGKVREVWLLVVNNRYLGPGEVYMRADVIANEQFDFEFDRVLVFLRDIGGSGEVVELQRRVT